MESESNCGDGASSNSPPDNTLSLKNEKVSQDLMDHHTKGGLQLEAELDENPSKDKEKLTLGDSQNKTDTQSPDESTKNISKDEQEEEKDGQGFSDSNTKGKLQLEGKPELEPKPKSEDETGTKPGDIPNKPRSRKEEKLTLGDSQNKTDTQSPDECTKNISKDEQGEEEEILGESLDTTVSSPPDEPLKNVEDLDIYTDVQVEGVPQPSILSETHRTPPTGEKRRDKSKLIAVGVVILACIWPAFYQCFPGSTPATPVKLTQVEVFIQEMEKLKTSFSRQRPELWKRSQIHISRHLMTKDPTEPVSLILTSGSGAEKTLGCLAQRLAKAFSTARNSSVVNYNGKGKSSHSSDQVKLDIDDALTNAFEGEKLAAVINRFEELPPGSTLIFYRYCDHENAAYKDVFLVFTIMLDTQEEVPPSLSLKRVEEMVQEHVKLKFVTSKKATKYNEMDYDKLSGLWSRISHVVLPVAAEERIELQGCEKIF